jgi:hypothetical protein
MTKVNFEASLSYNHKHSFGNNRRTSEPATKQVTNLLGWRVKRTKIWNIIRRYELQWFS